MKAEKSLMILSIFILLTIIVISTVFFTVSEGSVALVLRLGEFISEENKPLPKIYRPGLHIKYPIVDRVVRLSTKIQSINEQSSRVLTKEQKPVELDYFVKWRIKDFVKFYKATLASSSGRIDLSRPIDPSRAEYFLKNNVADVIRSSFGERNLHDIISGERHDILKELQEKSTRGAETFGIEVIDVRIKKLDYPSEISNSVYQRMRTKRQQVANLYRANGKFASEKIRSNADKEFRFIIAEAEKDAAAEIAIGEASAAKIYEKSYSVSKEFYKFYRRMISYQQSLGEKDILVIDPKRVQFFSEFYNFHPVTTTTKQ